MSIETLIVKMEECRNEMVSTAVEMEYYGGFKEEIIDKSKELFGASRIMGNWIAEIAEKDTENSDD